MLLQKQNRNTKARSPSRQGEGSKARYNQALMILFLVVLFGCSRKPFVNHKLKFEKISENCENLKPSFRMVSNVAGERYEFEKCLAANFSKDQMNVYAGGQCPGNRDRLKCCAVLPPARPWSA